MTKRYGLVLAGLLIAFLALPGPVAGADWPVTTGSDIAAVISGASGGDTITLAPGTYTWHDIEITGKSLTFRADTASGHGPGDTIIDAQSAGRIFNVTDASSLTIDNLTLRNGRAANGADGAGGGFDGPGTPGSPGSNGGAISSGGPVIIASSAITGCSAGSGGVGGWGHSIGGDGGAGGNGGAVYSADAVTVTGSTITDCSAGTGGVGGAG